MSKEITVRDAAERYGYNPESLRRLLREGKLRGRTIGITWLIEVKSLEAYTRQAGRRRPRGPRDMQ